MFFRNRERRIDFHDRGIGQEEGKGIKGLRKSYGGKQERAITKESK